MLKPNIVRDSYFSNQRMHAYVYIVKNIYLMDMFVESGKLFEENNVKVTWITYVMQNVLMSFYY